MRQSILLLIFIIIFIFSNIVLIAQDGWLLQEGNTERTSYVQSSMKPPFALTRTVDLPRDIEGFTYAYDMIYFFHGGSLGVSAGAFDPEKEEITWVKRVSTSTGANGCFPAVTENIIYASGQRAQWIYALDRLTGDSLWGHPTSGSNYGRSFAIKSDLFFAQPASYGLICLDRLTGNKLWEYGQNSARTVPLVDDEHAFFTTRSNDTIYALTHEGELDWKYLSPSGIEDFEAFLSTGDTIFFKSRGHLVALNAEDGSEFWKTKLDSDNSFISTVNALTWTPHVLINHEWVGDWRGAFMIQGFDKKTGQMIWSHPLKDESGTPATAFGGYLVHVNGGDLQIRRASDGEVVQEFTGQNYYPWSRVIAVDGMIFALRGSEIRVFAPEPTVTQDQQSGTPDWQILQNPASEILTIEVSLKEHGKISGQVIQMNGSETGISASWLVSGTQRCELDISALHPGIYILQLFHKGIISNRSFIVD